jgi:hypothetical protein
MKQGTKIIILAVLVVMAAAVFYFDSNGPSFSSRQSVFAAKTYSPLPVENPELQRWKLEKSRRTEYKSSGRDLFTETLPPPPVPKVVPKHVDLGPQLPAEPPPPTLPANMKYFGHGTVPNGTSRRGFLTDGEEVYIVAEGDTLLGRFRILKISNASLEFEELGSGRRNSTPLDEQAAPAQ